MWGPGFLWGDPVKTIVYVDGFNLYFGSLKPLPSIHKWLDVCALFTRILPAGCELVQVKYFTARVSALPHDPGAPARQDVYFRALREHCGAQLKIVEGRFSVKNVRMPLTSNPSQIVQVIKTEEKGSDVNLAVELVNDAWSGLFDCAAVVSNDSDLQGALRIAKQQLRKRVLLYTPGAPDRKPVSDLHRWCHKQLSIAPADLAACQLPNPVLPGPLHKPAAW